MRKPRLLRLSYLLWVLVIFAAYGGYRLQGLPHMIWSYSWVDPSSSSAGGRASNYAQGFDPLAGRYYTSCDFVGPYGVFRVPARSGRCEWVRFFKDPDETP